MNGVVAIISLKNIILTRVLGHPVKDDDIVRYSEETQRVKDKEP